MQPKLTLLDNEIIARILEEAYELLRCPGVKVQNPEARALYLFPTKALAQDQQSNLQLLQSSIENLKS